MDYVVKQTLKILGSSRTELDEASVKTIKAQFPIPCEHNILWADVDFGRRISGIVLTDVSLFIKGAKKQKDAKKQKGAKKQEATIYHYIKWEYFDIDDFKIEKNGDSYDIFFNNERVLFTTASNNFFRCYRTTYEDRIKESFVSANDVFAAVEAVTPENFAAVNTKTGHGQMAEEALTLLDRLSWKKADVVGRNNAKDGPDRIVDGVKIQTKYYSSGKGCIDSCFDKATGSFRYIAEGEIMTIEVPKDKYAEAIYEFRKRILNDKVPGVTNPDDASKYIKQGKLTYQQALNLCKAGTIESLTYDAATGAIVCTFAFGITFLVTFIFSYAQRGDRKEAMYSALLAGVQVFGLSFLSHMLTQQVARTNLTKQLIPLSEYLVRKMGSKAVQTLVNAIRSIAGKTPISGSAAMKQLAKMLRSNFVAVAFTIICFSIPYTYDIFRKRVSKAQYMKNMASLIGTIGGGIVGAGLTALGAAKIASYIGTTLSPGVGTVIGFFGGLVGGYIVGEITKRAGDFIREDDSVILARMFNGIVVNMCYEYMLQESEINTLIEKFNSIKPKEFEKLFKSIIASNAQEKEVCDFICHYYEDIIRSRPVIKEPTPEDLLALAKTLTNSEKRIITLAAVVSYTIGLLWLGFGAFSLLGCVVTLMLGRIDAAFVCFICFVVFILTLIIYRVKQRSWGRKTAEQGNAEAQFILGKRYDNGDGVEKNAEEAVEWYRKAAEQGNSDAQLALGGCYSIGCGVEENPEEAIKWLLKAVEQGNSDAQLALGRCYLNGYGVEENPEEAFKWYRKAAEQGNSDAQLALGGCYSIGCGVEENLEEAVKWYRKAAEQGNSDAQLTLGDCYLNGYCVEENPEEAVKWVLKATEQGNANAQNVLGHCYEKGLGVEENPEEAIKWYRKALEQGAWGAIWSLGDMYRNGKLKGKNLTEVVKYCRKVAEQGNTIAQDFLGDYYRDEKNPEEAIKWYLKSVGQGSVDAKPTSARVNTKVGDIIPFGRYDWRVLDVQNGKALILSVLVVEERAYHRDEYADVTWEKCDLRKYLNSTFYNSFSVHDKASIVEKKIVNNDNPCFETKGGNATYDKIFLLSIEEVVKYFGDSGCLKSINSEEVYFIDDQYSFARRAVGANGKSKWWLRSPGSLTCFAAHVDILGNISVAGDSTHNDNIGVRPALWLHL